MSPDTVIDVRHLTLSSIAARCDEETRRFSNRQATTLQCCYELFRRALQDHSEEAWEKVLEQYSRLMRSWVTRHPSFPSTGEQAEYFVNGACARLWERVTPDRFERFLDIRSLLRYLQMCIHSAIIDYTRRHGSISVEFDDQHEETISVSPDATLAAAERAELWRAVDARLANEKERLVVRGLFVYGMKPAEIRDHYRGTFRDVREIYAIRENVLDRLARDHQIKAFAEHDT